MSSFIRFRSCALLSGATLLAGAAGSVLAADYPTRPIRYVVGFAPGGINDIMARLVGQKLTESWGQPVIVDNRPGAGGNVAAELVSRSAPDGYTIMNISTAHAISQTLYTKLGYSLEKDLAPVVVLGTSPLITAINPNVPAKTVAEFIAWARNGKAIYASGGVGVISHLSMEMLQTATGVKMTHVPYKGAGPGVADVMTGQVHVMTNAIPELFPFAKGGKLRIIGLMDEKRHPFMPDVPTFGEQGIKGFVMGNWTGIIAPAATPAATRARLAQEVTRILQAPEMRKRLEDQGVVPLGGTPESFGKLIASEVVRFGAAVKASGATAN